MKSMHIIAADVGGTKTRFAFADAGKQHAVLYEALYLSEEFDDFGAMLQTFIGDCGSASGEVGALSLAFPGLVNGSSAHLTNLPWNIEKQSLIDTFGIKNVYFMNDFEASVSGISQLLETDSVMLHPGIVNVDAMKKNTVRVAVGAGTGLGVAWVVGKSSNNYCSACRYDSEGGHIDFAPSNDVQVQLLQFLQRRFEHVSYERVLSGDGLVSLYQFCADDPEKNVDAAWVNKHSGNNQAANQALSLFVQIYGAYIGNIALLFKPYGGIYITGGIAAKMLNRMQSEAFINAYLNKGRMRKLVEKIAVHLVTNDRVGVLGAMSEAIKLQQATE